MAFTWIGIDELGHYPSPFVWNYLRSRLRTTDPSIDTYMRATANPGGSGGHWIKKMFIDPSPPNEPFWATDTDTGIGIDVFDDTEPGRQPQDQRIERRLEGAQQTLAQLSTTTTTTTTPTRETPSTPAPTISGGESPSREAPSPSVEAPTVRTRRTRTGY